MSGRSMQDNPQNALTAVPRRRYFTRQRELIYQKTVLDSPALIGYRINLILLVQQSLPLLFP
jgi:hypothetical protein